MAPAGPPLTGDVNFHYIKNSSFRTAHADGIWGGVTPRGLLNMAFYSERWPLPKLTALPVTNGQPTGPEVVREVRDGLIRELEFNVTMDIHTAVALHVWLGQKLEELRKINGLSAEQLQEIFQGASPE